MTEGAVRTLSRPDWLTVSREGALQLLLHVQPGAKRSAIVGEHGGRLKVALAAPPVDGKANAALVKFLAETLKLSKKNLRLAAGELSREKRLEVSGLSEAELLAALSSSAPKRTR